MHARRGYVHADRNPPSFATGSLAVVIRGENGGCPDAWTIAEAEWDVLTPIWYSTFARIRATPATP
jgi:hypothetical protein